MRQIKLQGAYNFRDFGGYKTLDNKRVKTGLLYRSDELSKLTDEDIRVLESLPLKTIIDYRSDFERQDNEDKKISGCKVVYLDPKADVAAMASDELKQMRMSKEKTLITAKQAYTLMSNQNIEFVRADTSKQAYKEMLEILLDVNNCPCVQHCRGGKDRTGYGVALILLLLGVDLDTVIDDYLLTNVCKQEKNEKSLKEAYEKTHNEDFVEALSYLKKANVEFIMRAINLINDEYGGIYNYVINELDFDAEKIEKLKKIYLEENNEF